MTALWAGIQSAREIAQFTTGSERDIAFLREEGLANRLNAELKLQARLATLNNYFQAAKLYSEGGLRNYAAGSLWIGGEGLQPQFGSAFPGGKVPDLEVKAETIPMPTRPPERVFEPLPERQPPSAWPFPPQAPATIPGTVNTEIPGTVNMENDTFMWEWPTGLPLPSSGALPGASRRGR